MTEPTVDFTKEQIDAAVARGQDIFDDLLNDLDAEDDPIGVAYSLWVSLGRYLVNGGWSMEELVMETIHHASDQLAKGRA
jgi:hypothetical protein